MASKGVITRVVGPVVHAVGLSGTRAQKNSVVQVGEAKLIGEIVQIVGEKAIIQVYESTSGLKIGEPVVDLKRPLTVKLGPGLLDSIIDGVQRQLRDTGYLFIEKGMASEPLPSKKKWHFVPTYEQIKEMKIGKEAKDWKYSTVDVKAGQKLIGGEILGAVQETQLIKHYILNPPTQKGVIKEIKEGDYMIEDPIGYYEDGSPIRLYHYWPVRVPRPVSKRIQALMPYITGQRILDFMYPIVEGGTAMIPGGFGTGKTVLEQTLSKFASAHISVLTLCGERGNEIADVLHEFKHLMDPLSGLPMSQRSIIIANTSNMPVAAREASIYAGVTYAEYFRDQGYRAAVTADSTSRWAEALREVSARLEEVPGEKGYPSYLPKLIGQFYERAGKMECLSGRNGSVTVVGAVSPPGGDFSEPVTQYTMRYANALWALDVNLARQRHYPAINWKISYTQYLTEVLEYWEQQPHIGKSWRESRQVINNILKQEEDIEKIVRLIGKDTLSETQLGVLTVSELIREGFLRQSAFSDIDGNSSIEKTHEMALTLQTVYDEVTKTIAVGFSNEELLDKEKVIFEDIRRMKETNDIKVIKELRERIKQRFQNLRKTI